MEVPRTHKAIRAQGSPWEAWEDELVSQLQSIEDSVERGHTTDAINAIYKLKADIELAFYLVRS